MNVNRILRSKGSGVETTHGSTPVIEVVRRLAEAGIGSLCVRDGDRILGLLTERDIVQGIARLGPAALSLPARTLISAIRTCHPEDDVKHVMSVMTRTRNRHLLVMSAEQVHGIVSIGDVVKARLDEMQLEANVLRDCARASMLQRG